MDDGRPKREAIPEQHDLEHRTVEQALWLRALEYRQQRDEVVRSLEAPRVELGATFGSLQWTWAMRVRRLRYQLIGGSGLDRRQFLGAFGRSLLRCVVRPARFQVGAGFAAEVQGFIERAAACSSEWVTILLSGSSYIEEPLSHAMQHLAVALRAREVPVFFSACPPQTGQVRPAAADRLLLQAPSEGTVWALPSVSKAGFGGKGRVFLAGYPDLLCVRWAGELSSLGWITHYHCLDDWPEFARLGIAPWYREGAERLLALSCDVVTASAAAQVERLKALGRRGDVHLLRNAPADRFLAPDLADRVAPRSGPEVLGYFGALTEQFFDWPALLEIARRKPEWRFEIIGHDAPPRLSLPHNMRLLGRRDHDQIRRIASRWRAAIIPFKPGPLADGVDPIKVYEYLALGLPVVAFEMAQVAGYPYVSCARTADEFVARAAEAMAMPLERAVIAAFLAANRWETRADEMLGLWAAAADRPSLLRGLSVREGAP